jgi:hypothetical protein
MIFLRYTENAKNISNIFKARAETPLQRGIFWIEYVIRFKGAEFLNIALRDLPFYKSSIRIGCNCIFDFNNSHTTHITVPNLFIIFFSFF